MRRSWAILRQPHLLRAPFSLEKITWIEDTGSVVYRSRRSWRTKRNFEVFAAADFLAAAVSHILPKNQQTVRYYGLYSNKRRGLDTKTRKPRPRICLTSCARLHERPPSTRGRRS